MPRTALTKSRVKIQEDNYSVQWPTLTSGSGVATASAAMQTLGVSNLNYSGGIWFKELSKRLTFGNIIFRLTAATPFRYAFQIITTNSDRFGVSFYDGTLNPNLFTTKSSPIGGWYHVAFTREGTTVKIYVNGVLSNTGTITVGTTASNSVGLGVSSAFAGNVSDAFIYGSVLTADEIYAIYANDVYPSGALLKAKLNDGTGTTAADQSGNGVDFTLTTPTWSTDTATGKRAANTFPQRKTPDNLLSNGNFEYAPPFTAATTTTARWIDGTSGGSSATTGPYGWYIGAKGGSVAASFDSTAPLSGANSLKLSTTATASSIQVYSFSSGNPGKKLTLIPALPNTTYTMTFSMKTNVVSGSATGVNAGIFEYDGQGTNVTSLRTTAVNTTTDKTFYTVTKTTSSTTRFIGAVIILEGSDGAGTLIMDAWFDDITLTTTAPYSKRKVVDNLVINGDFESVPTFTAATNTANRYIDGTAAGLNAVEFPYEWFAPGTFANATAQYDTSVKFTGTASMKLSTTTTAGLASALYGNNTSAANIKQTMIPVLPSTSYTVSGYCKTSNVATAAAHIDIYEYNGAGTLGATSTTNTLTGTNDWTLVTATFTTASTARYLTLALRNHVAGNVSDAWFDNVTLVKN